MYIQKLLRELEFHRHALNTLANAITIHPEVISTDARIELRQYGKETRIEAWLDIELRDGTALTWWADILLQNDWWEMQVSISKTDEYGQEQLSAACVSGSYSIDGIRAQFFTQIMRAKQPLCDYIVNASLLKPHRTEKYIQQTLTDSTPVRGIGFTSKKDDITPSLLGGYSTYTSNSPCVRV